MRVATGVIRVAVAAIIVAAIIDELLRSHRLVEVSLLEHLGNYVSYFTTLSNASAAAVLVIGSCVAFRRDTDPPWYSLAFACVVTYMVTTGAVYNFALRAVVNQVGWANEMLHLIGVVYVVIVWIVMPGRHVVRWSRTWLIVVFPAGWLGYTMIRGLIDGWYPYSFLDPSQPGGPLPALGWAVLIGLFIGGVSIIVVGASRMRLPWHRVHRMPSDAARLPALWPASLAGALVTAQRAPDGVWGHLQRERPQRRRLSSRSPSVWSGYHRPLRGSPAGRHPARPPSRREQAARPPPASHAPHDTVHRKRRYRERAARLLQRRWSQRIP
ncbi:hypothetical protein GCM10027416_17720 [Okibacterium endophyticum]